MTVLCNVHWCAVAGLGLSEMEFEKGSLMPIAEAHYCKHCGVTFPIRVPIMYCGDAIIECDCGWKHPRQFDDGIAYSCDLPKGRYITIKRAKEPTNG